MRAESIRRSGEHTVKDDEVHREVEAGMRDDRTEAFTSLLWGGVHEYTYYARATTPGEFVVPPAKAEEMYSPETFGRSASDRVVVK